MGNGILTKRTTVETPSSKLVDKARFQNRAGPTSRQLARVERNRIGRKEESENSKTRLLSPEGMLEENPTDLAPEDMLTGETKLSAECKSMAETKTESPCRSLDYQFENPDVDFRNSTDHTRGSFAEFQINCDHPSRPTTPPAKRDRPHHVMSPVKADKMSRSPKVLAAKPKDKYQISKWVVRRPQRSISDPRRQRDDANMTLFRNECSHVGCGDTCRYAVSHTGIADLQMRLRRNLNLMDVY